ncbi:hypothetical protein [Patulibacter sp.]|uniref:hypothetical protein n=1 Tax=Patulibacter sp. TaxID=1912859 RepID=UPI0027207D9E|nr:hypothetical protein [Patulibacter sp.]MDO9406980.1 hypothetical protein [Patulibacter sp.]
MSTSPFLPADDPRAGACGQCGAPMATDQRYCLSCGARRTHARLPFQDAMAPVGPVVQVPGPAPALWSTPATSGPGTTTLLAALACVLLAFGVGVLAGGDGDGGSQQPIVLGGAPAASAVAPTTTEAAATSTTDTTASEDDASSSDATTKIDKKNLDATEKQEAAEIEKTPSKTPPAKAISDQTKKDLASKDPDKAREASQSLPDVVSTGGG